MLVENSTYSFRNIIYKTDLIILEKIYCTTLLTSVSCLLIFQCTIKYIYYIESFYVDVNKFCDFIEITGKI